MHCHVIGLTASMVLALVVPVRGQGTALPVPVRAPGGAVVVGPPYTNTAPFGSYNTFGSNTPYGFETYNPFVGYPGYRGTRIASGRFRPIRPQAGVIRPRPPRWLAPRRTGM
jgi:hypothetical protein